MRYLAKINHPASILEGMNRMINQYCEYADAHECRGFSVDIAESGDSYRIEAELPGFSSSEVEVKVKENLLIIEARQAEISEEKSSFRTRERIRGNRSRSFTLPEDVDKDAVNAELKNGLLEVVLKKKPEVQPLSIKVQGGR
ncbi:MAG: hypothetical protein B6D68_00435 [spirochete symbiont of Stewartia floridana]|nr:MAG: hypothetical protein B6D68_00435 [spirochete symbiont of Stewartia floridana]